MKLKYGMNPYQDYAEVIDKHQALKLKNGNPSVINVLDALNAWQLVKEIHQTLHQEASTSFKHVTPVGRCHSWGTQRTGETGLPGQTGAFPFGFVLCKSPRHRPTGLVWRFHCRQPSGRCANRPAHQIGSIRRLGGSRLFR